MGKKVSLAVVATLMAITAAVTFSITILFSMQYFNQKVQSLSEREAAYSKLAEIDGIVRSNLFGTINETTLNDSVASGYIRGLGGKLGTYYTAANYASYQEIQSGTIVGVGIETTADSSGYRKVTAVYSGSPAAESGVAAQDLIIKVDGNDLATAGNSYDTLMTGGVGSNVTLTLRRGTEESDLTLTRKKITIQSVYTDKVEHAESGTTVGVIKIKTFNDQTLSQFITGLEGLRSEGISKFVFDLRGNTGGNLEVAASILQKLLPESTIASYKNNEGVETQLYKATGEGTPITAAVLINGSTEAEAEVFAAALSENGYAKLIGTATAGNGGMKKFFRLNDGSAIRLNIGVMITPQGNIFDGVGLKPDFIVKLSAELEKDPSIMTKDTDAQLKKALEVVTAVSAQKN